MCAWIPLGGILVQVMCASSFLVLKMGLACAHPRDRTWEDELYCFSIKRAMEFYKQKARDPWGRIRYATKNAISNTHTS